MHTLPSNVYRERIDDSRLREVAEYVRDWLFADDASDKKSAGKRKKKAKKSKAKKAKTTGKAKQAPGDDDEHSLRLFVG